MTDYREEQTNEIEALESIYPSEFEILDTEPYYKFSILVKSEEYDEEDEETEGSAVSLVFQYTSCYPDEAPIFEIVPVDNFSEESIEDLRLELKEQCDDNMGMVMVFTLVSFTLEWLNNKIEEDKRRVIEEIERIKMEEEAEEKKKFEGTRVTVEAFLVWKTKFDFEKNSTKEKTKDDDKKKLTGRELFMTDETLNESDLNFLGKDGDEVAVDESLFQDLEDLDLDEEIPDDDDEDFS